MLKRDTAMLKRLITVLGVLAVAAIAYAMDYTTVNSNFGRHLCEPGFLTSGKCSTVDTQGKMLRTVRSLALTRNPGGGNNVWSCTSTSSDGTCSRNSNTTDKLIVKSCSNNGCSRNCRFGSSFNGNFTDEGLVQIDLCTAQQAFWVFNNGGVGTSTPSQNKFTYTGP